MIAAAFALAVVAVVATAGWARCRRRYVHDVALLTTALAEALEGDPDAS